MRNEKIRKITVDAMFLAIMTIMTFVPYIGFIPLGPITVTVLHVVVLIGAAYGGTLRGLLYGFFFGILSLLKAAIAPGSDPTAPFFVNPLVSVLPRMVFGLLAGVTFDLLFKLKNNTAKALLIPVSSFVLTMIHSVATLTMLVLCANSDSATWAAMGATLSSFSLVEAAVAFVMVLPVAIAIVPRAIELKNQRDVSEILGVVGCSYVWLPIVTWIVCGLGYQQSKAFGNEKTKKLNFWALIVSFIVLALILITSMILQAVLKK